MDIGCVRRHSMSTYTSILAGSLINSLDQKEEINIQPEQYEEIIKKKQKQTKQKKWGKA